MTCEKLALNVQGFHSWVPVDRVYVRLFVTITVTKK
jgi:hypothetical protein